MEALSTWDVPGATRQGAPRRRPLAGAHVATEFGGQEGPGRPHPAWKATRARGADWGAFFSTGLEEVLPARTGHLGATAVAGVPGPAGP